MSFGSKIVRKEIQYKVRYNAVTKNSWYLSDLKQLTSILYWMQCVGLLAYLMIAKDFVTCIESLQLEAVDKIGRQLAGLNCCD